MTRRDEDAADSKGRAAGGNGDAAETVRGNVEAARPDANELRQRIAATLADLAATLEGTAGVAERIAERAAESGRFDLAARERKAAKQARKLAKRLRAVARPTSRRQRP